MVQKSFMWLALNRMHCALKFLWIMLLAYSERIHRWIRLDYNGYGRNLRDIYTLMPE